VRVRTQCRECGLPFSERIRPDAELICPKCGAARTVAAAGWGEDSVAVCPICGCRHLYRQRDFNRGLGCLLVAVGAVLVPWTYGLSLVALSLVDLWLYRRLRDAVVCYRCDTVYRDARPGEGQVDFDLLKHDVLKYGKSWQEAEGAGGPAAGAQRGSEDLTDRRSEPPSRPRRPPPRAGSPPARRPPT
jgi:DNA-directed RNA polymerase subunit RPC12/RpoP